jgi:branched-chain amino acid transport system ATP-binding protein
MLVVTDLHAGYGASRVVQGISLNVRPGEIAVLLGRNGAGKTTTLHSLIGFVTPASGQVHVAGQSVAGWPPHRIARLGVGLVPQGRGVFPTLTVRENITLAARGAVNGGWTLDRVLTTFPPLAARLGHLGAHLSGGEQQMLALARALMLNPRLLLLDEPSEGLAPLIVAEIGRVLAALRAEGLAILLVEQNLALALTLADKVYVMNKGQIVFEGDPQALQADEAVKHRYLGV